jgi:hydroxymethylpyrimidine/phosphomethylpyrimidine kinase
MSELPPIVLVFAASDPSGGAGLQADIMTLSSMGCHPFGGHRGDYTGR